MPKTPVKDLGKKDEATIMFGDKVPIELYEVVVDGKTLDLWLSPSDIEER
jgi:hypothetical protein